MSIKTAYIIIGLFIVNLVINQFIISGYEQINHNLLAAVDTLLETCNPGGLSEKVY